MKAVNNWLDFFFIFNFFHRYWRCLHIPDVKALDTTFLSTKQAKGFNVSAE